MADSAADRRTLAMAPSMSNVMQQTSTVPYCLKCAAYLADLADPAKVAHTGFLEKKKGKLSGWKARYFVVAGHHAAYYAQEADVGKTLPFGVFHLENSPVELDKDDKTFSLCVDDVVWSMRAQTAEDRHRWADVFRQSDLRLAAAAGKLPLGHPFYCPQLGSYVDHDVFTLADADGALTVAGPNLPPQKVWAAFSRPHLGLFQSEEHVGRYTSLRRLYIEPDRVNRVEKSTPERPFGFSVVCKEGIYLFSASSADERDTWLSWLRKV